MTIELLTPAASQRRCLSGNGHNSFEFFLNSNRNKNKTMNSNAAKYLKPQSFIALENINQFKAKIKYKNAKSYCFTHDTSSECSFTRVLYATSNKIFYFIQNRLEYSVYFIDICRIGDSYKQIN